MSRPEVRARRVEYMRKTAYDMKAEGYTHNEIAEFLNVEVRRIGTLITLYERLHMEDEV